MQDSAHLPEITQSEPAADGQPATVPPLAAAGEVGELFLARYYMIAAESSARLNRVTTDAEFDAEIDRTLNRLGQLFGMSRAYVFEFSADMARMTNTHEWCAAGVLSQKHRIRDAPIATFPWWMARMAEGGPVYIPDVTQLPDAAVAEKRELLAQGVRNLICVPLCNRQGKPTGFLGLDEVDGHAHPWPETHLVMLQQVADSVGGAMMRRRAEKALQRQLRYEQGISAAATALLKSETAVDPIVPFLNCLREASDAARVYVFDNFSDPKDGLCSRCGYEVCAPGISAEIDNPALRHAPYAGIPRWHETLSAGQAIRGQVCDFPPAERAILEPQGIISIIVLPVFGGDEWMGFIGFDETRGPREWLDEEVSLLWTAADILGGFLSRLRIEQELRASRALLVRSQRMARLGSWELDLRTQRLNWSDEIYRIFGVTKDAFAGTYEAFLDIVHPDDRGAVDAAFAASVRDGKDGYEIRHRIIQAGTGEIRHVLEKSVHERDSDGKIVRSVGVVQDITERTQAEATERERDRLQDENVYLRTQVAETSGHLAIVGESERMVQMLDQARKVAPTDSTVLITGETGTGKELLARFIHASSPRRTKPMVTVNCAALPAPLIESELFGREKGAYTGAMTRQVGRFELADTSTLFLDEIGELSMDVQVKLLRIIDEGRFERLGSTRTLQTDVRLIAATHRDLDDMVRSGRFREDLLHRLNVFPIHVPPLRERKDDIPMLVWSFVDAFNQSMGRSVDSIPKDQMEVLMQQLWPGNVRELRNLIDRSMIINDSRRLSISIPRGTPAPSVQGLTLEAVERRHILAVLERTHWRIRGPGGAADILDLAPTTLHSRLKKLGLSRPGHGTVKS